MLEAGIEYLTDLGKADFHALRYTFCSMLARSGIQPQIAQKLMRHSDANLTIKHYTHILLDDKRMAVSSLPRINVEEKVAEATGTEDAANLGRIQPPSLCPNSAYFLPNCADSTDTPQASFRQRSEEETSHNTSQTQYKTTQTL